MVLLFSLLTACVVFFGIGMTDDDEACSVPCNTDSLSPMYPICQGSFEDIRTTEEDCTVIMLDQSEDGAVSHTTFRSWHITNDVLASTSPECLCQINARWPGSVRWERQSPCAGNV
jgi:hypothetical protein